MIEDYSWRPMSVPVCLECFREAEELDGPQDEDSFRMRPHENGKRGWWRCARCGAVDGLDAPPLCQTCGQPKTKTEVGVWLCANGACAEDVLEERREKLEPKPPERTPAGRPSTPEPLCPVCGHLTRARMRAHPEYVGGFECPNCLVMVVACEKCGRGRTEDFDPDLLMAIDVVDDQKKLMCAECVAAQGGHGFVYDGSAAQAEAKDAADATCHCGGARRRVVRGVDAAPEPEKGASVFWECERCGCLYLDADAEIPLEFGTLKSCKAFWQTIDGAVARPARHHIDGCTPKQGPETTTHPRSGGQANPEAIMGEPTIFGREPEKTPEGFLWRIGPWELWLYVDGIAVVALEISEGHQIAHIEPNSSAAELESWLRVMLTETCEALGFELPHESGEET